MGAFRRVRPEGELKQERSVRDSARRLSRAAWCRPGMFPDESRELTSCLTCLGERLHYPVVEHPIIDIQRRGGARPLRIGMQENGIGEQNVPWAHEDA